MYNFDVAPLPSHPLLDSILTPFNRVDINSHLSILLPTSSYKITDKSRGATLLLKDGNFRYAVPVVVFTTLPQELLDCIDVTGIRKLVCRYINSRFRALEIPLEALSIFDLTFMRESSNG